MGTVLESLATILILILVMVLIVHMIQGTGSTWLKSKLWASST